MNDYIQQVLDLDITEGETVRVEKIVSFFTSHDNAITETLTAAGRHVERYPDFAGCFAEHVDAWEEYWDVCDIELPREPTIQLLLRFHMAHVLQVCSRHTARHDAGVPARGLNGEAYRGHVFWDELYVYPFLNYRLPEITRGLLMYRYRRLAEAREAARAEGYAGAMFPWQSGSDGTEETQVVHLNPLSGTWDPDHSHNQRHVNAAIFYNVWQYYQATDDLEFLRDYGAELMLEIARFWGSIAHKNPNTGRYEIHGVMGPDEFHERYPGADDGRAAQQRLHQRHGRLDLRDRPEGAGPAAQEPPPRPAQPARDHRRRDRALVGDVHVDDGADPPRRRRPPRDHPVRGLRGPRRARLGRLPGQAQEHPADGPHPQGRG